MVFQAITALVIRVRHSPWMSWSSGSCRRVLVVGFLSSDLALVSEEDQSAEGVERFAFVELGVDSASVLVVVEVAQE